MTASNPLQVQAFTTFDVAAYTRDAQGRIAVDQQAVAPLDDRLRADLEFLWRLDSAGLSETRAILGNWTGNEARITAFVATWAVERMWLAWALRDILAAEGPKPEPRSHTRLTARLRDVWVERAMPVVVAPVAAVVGESITAGHMLRLALQEASLQATYAAVLPRLDGEAARVVTEIIARRATIVEFFELEASARIDTVVVSTQHNPDISHAQLSEAVIEEIIKPVLPKELLSDKTRYLVNPTGRFVVGGPHGDCGLTGRKIIVDTYGGMARHGGGAFSGKDPSKVDRSAAYAARHVAKNIVAAGLADRCEVQIAYAIGVAKPVSLMVDTFGTGKIADEKIVELIGRHFDLRPKGIIQELDLLRPIYTKTAAYGHFGREEPEFTWEAIDKAPALRADAGL